MAVELAEPLHVTTVRDRLARFESLYGRYHAPLVSTCTSMTGDRAAAEDLAQETMLRAYQHLDWLDVTRAWPWLKTVASRLAIDEHRKWGRVGSLEDGDDYAADASELDGAETRQVLAEAMSRLPARQRLAMTLRYVADYEPAEAAAALHLDSSAFKQLLYRARGRLQTEYRRLTAGVSGVILWPLLLLRRWRVAMVGLRNSFSASRLRTLLHPALELGAALFVFTALGMIGPVTHPSTSDSGGSGAGASSLSATHDHRSSAGAGATLASWIGFGAWAWPYAPSGKDGSMPNLLCAAPVGNGTPAKDVVATAAATIKSLAPTAASAGEQAQSTVGCGGSTGSQPAPILGGRGTGPVLAVNVGGVLVPIQAVVSQLPHGVASLARAVLTGGRLPAALAEKLAALPQPPQPSPTETPVKGSSKDDTSSTSSTKGSSSKDGSSSADSDGSSDTKP